MFKPRSPRPTVQEKILTLLTYLALEEAAGKPSSWRNSAS